MGLNTQPPALMPEADRMREAFESDMLEQEQDITRYPVWTHQYDDDGVQWAWRAYKRAYQAAHTDTAATIKGLEARIRDLEWAASLAIAGYIDLDHFCSGKMYDFTEVMKRLQEVRHAGNSNTLTEIDEA